MSAAEGGSTAAPAGAAAGKSFGARLEASVAAHGPLVVGIDPHVGLLEDWGLGDDAQGLRAFSQAVLEAVGEGDAVAAIKPQSAFFERHGSAGVAVLEELLATARARGVLAILDVKRGDIGSTMGAYAQAHLRPGAPLEADAITVSPFLGSGSLDPAVDLALEHGKGLFVLALTSNPDGPQVQHARTRTGRAVAAEVARHAEMRGAQNGHWSSIGLVVGATVGEAFGDLGLAQAAPTAPLLAPGFGAQGAGRAELDTVFGEHAGHVLVSQSRGVLSAGPDPAALRTRIEQLRAQYS